MLNWLARYQPIIRLLDECSAETVLDVGSGRHGVSWYWPHAVTQTDVDVEPVGLVEAERAGTATLVPGRAEALPFADGEFDFAVSSDVLEHLPQDIRTQSIRELCRVARRGVIIGCPVGEDAARLDRRLDRVFRALRRPQPWLDEHLRQTTYPDRSLVETSLPPGWAIVQEVRSGNIMAQTLLVVGEQLPGLGALSLWAERHYRSRPLPRWFDRGRVARLIWLVRPGPRL